MMMMMMTSQVLPFLCETAGGCFESSSNSYYMF